MSVGDIVIHLRAEAAALDAGLGLAERRVGTFGQRVQRVGTAATKGITVPVLAAAALTSKLALDFEDSFTKIEALVGVDAKAIEGLKEQVLDLAVASGQGPKELAEALYFIESSGLQGAYALDALEASAKASAAGLGETAVVADAVTSAMNAYGPEVLSAQKATDIMLAGIREGKNEPTELAASIGRVIPVAQRMGVEFGEVVGIMASMSLNGTDANEAVTQIVAALSTAIRPTKEGADMLRSIGRSYADLRAEIRERGLLATLRDLNDAYGGNIEKLGAVFGNVRALRGLLSLTGPSAEKYAGIVRDVSAAHGDLDRAFKTTAEKDAFRLQQSWAELQKVGIEFGAEVLPMLVDLVEEGTKVVKWLDDLSPSTKEAAVKLLLFAAAVGPVASGVGRLIGWYQRLRAATKAATAAQETLNIVQGLSGGVGGAGGAVSKNAARRFGQQAVAGQIATNTAGAGASAAAAGSISAAAAIGAAAAITAIAASPFLVGKVVESTVGNTRYGGEEKKGMITGGSKGGVAGGGRWAAYQDRGAEPEVHVAVKDAIARVVVDLQTADSLKEVEALGARLRGLREFAKLEIDASDLKDKTPGELDSFVQRIHRATGLGEKLIKRLLNEINGTPLEFKVKPPKLTATERAFNNLVKVARKSGNDTVKDWSRALVGLEAAGGKAGARAAAAMLAKLNTLPPAAADIAARIAQNLLNGVSGAVSTAEMRLEHVYERQRALNPGRSAAGRIVDSPLLTWVGEDYRREVILPLTDKARTVELMGQAGMFEPGFFGGAAAGLSAGSGPGGERSSLTAAVGGGDTYVQIVHRVVLPDRTALVGTAEDVSHLLAPYIKNDLVAIAKQHGRRR